MPHRAQRVLLISIFAVVGIPVMVWVSIPSLDPLGSVVVASMSSESRMVPWLQQSNPAGVTGGV